MEDVIKIISNRDGQFMILAAFIIAMGLVIVTVYLNTIIFEYNTSLGEGKDYSKNDLINLIEITKDEMRSAYSNANESTDFEKEMRNFSSNLSVLYAQYGEIISIDWDIDNWNESKYANFTQNGLPDGDSNWTIVYGANSSLIDLFRLNITVKSGSFSIDVTNQSGFVWSVEFNSTHYKIRNATNTTSFIYTPNNEIDLKEYLNISTSPNDKISFNIINGTNAYGRYWIQGKEYDTNKTFIKKRDYVFNATLNLSTSNMKSSITIPISVPW